ncbi:MAG: filamentous hemagglutinin N-terminal domain-containing protein [Nostoc sp. TH1S01]|nr:filamentous hemagglutinin N-terminal domain-containing protein [Nostoc sp. TH1S01]
MSNFKSMVTMIDMATSTAIFFYTNCAVAQIIPDNTLPINSLREPDANNIIINITGGTPVNGNLFHSFEHFSVLRDQTAYFNNPHNIQNIITRVTGNSISNIQGTIKANHTANLFLINPNGIIFGPNASLQIGGSFLASTASSVNFADGTKFSATEPQTTSLLRVSIPIGLQFSTSAASITNQSQAINNEYSVGLQVKPGKTLALVGGDITLKGGRLTAESGRIELGSVASNNLVRLKATEQGWALGYDGVKNFQNIQLIPRTTSNGADIRSVVDTSSSDMGGSIQVRGKIVRLRGSDIRSFTFGNTNGQNITITTEKLIVQDGSQVQNSTFGGGNAGNLTVYASESVELLGSVKIIGIQNIVPSLLEALTTGQGNGGDITINTSKLSILDGARLTVSATLRIEEPQSILAQGNAGNIQIKAWESVEIAGLSTEGGQSSRLSASTLNNTSAGIVNINTGKLIVRDGGLINVDVFNISEDTSNLATPGQINVTAGSILLDNQGEINARSTSGRGGNITLNVRDVLLLRRGSQISANAGTEGTGGDGGNITINAPNGFVVAVPSENSDITANAFFGSGGRITINASSIFGFVPRTRADLERELNTTNPEELRPSRLQTSDITAFSLQNPFLSGTVELNTPDVDPSKGIVELPANLIDAAQQIIAGCNPDGKLARGSLVATGRGGIAPSPREPLMSNDALAADWITLKPERGHRVDGVEKKVVIDEQSHTSVRNPAEIVKAQGWVIDANGNVVLVAQPPTVTRYNPVLASASCLEKSSQ